MMATVTIKKNKNNLNVHQIEVNKMYKLWSNILFYLFEMIKSSKDDLMSTSDQTHSS